MNIKTEWKKGPLLVSADPSYQNTVRQALCALLHQLFSQKPSLIKHAIQQFRKDRQGPVIIVLNALDKCAKSEFTDLMRHIESHFRNNQSSHGKLKYLLTYRPYNQIVSKFRGLLNAFPNIHIPGEEESETISQEHLSPQIKSYLEKRLQKTAHRTYLWVYLIFNYLQKEDFKKTLKGIESTIATVPRSVNKAYKQILNKTKEDPMVRKVLSIILAASRPLTLSEINVAVNIDYTS
ncbi:hypothetical protein J3F84DRAFT_391972 [Trichoderma pleuroticola]